MDLVSARLVMSKRPVKRLLAAVASQCFPFDKYFGIRGIDMIVL